jgi:hypothetical protein
MPVYAFGVADASFITPGASPTYTDIPGVTEAELKLETEKVELKGDDDILATFFHSPKATITLKNCVVDLGMWAKVTGDTVQSSGGTERIPIGTANVVNPPSFMLRLKVKAKDTSDSSVKYLYIYLYNCVGTITMEGPKYGEAVTCTIEANCLPSTKDERNQNLSTPARGRLEIASS